ncbi:diguanylate cyclase [Bacillus sp. JJ664]
MIIKELFSNLAILTSLLFMYSQLTKNSPLNRKSSFIRKITMGILGGLLGNMLMQYSMHVGDTLVDLRHIPIILLAFYSGPIPAFVSMILIIVGRFLIGVNLSSFFNIPLMLLVTTGVLYFSRMKLSGKKRVVLSLTWNNLVFTVIASYLIKSFHILILLIPAYWLVSYIGGFIAFYIINYIRSIQSLFSKYKNESTIDGLTGLNNYRKFDEIFNTLIKTIDQKQEKLALLYIDIDFFKKINDRYGHVNGDEVLKELGEILQKCARSFDIISRNGGEEFTVLLMDSSLDKAKEISEKIRKTVEEYPFHISEKKIFITVSIGIASYNETTMDLNNLIDDADKALYIAKKTGRNKVCISNNELILNSFVN